MAGKIKPLSAILIAALLVAAVGGAEEAAIPCNIVFMKLTPCIPYITGIGPLIARCCFGVNSVHKSANTTADRQEACGCLKTFATKFPNIKYEIAAELPKKCGVDMPYVISPDIDCSKVE